MKRIWAPVIIAVLAASLFTGFLSIDNYREQNNEEQKSRSIFRSIDSRFFDFLLRLKPAIPEDSRLLLIEADDRMIAEVNKYPLPRDVFADGLILMAEFSPQWTILDIEFVEASEEGIDYSWLDRGLPDRVNDVFRDLYTNQQELIEGIISGRITASQAREYLNDTEKANWKAADNILEAVGHLTYSKDIYLGKAISYLGNVSATINMSDEVISTLSPELREWARNTVNINDYLTIDEDPIHSAVDILPAIHPVITSASWAGFPKMHIDPDGVRRRVDVLYKQDGQYFTHLGFGSWWVRAGKPPIRVRRRQIEVGDMVIPLDHNGKMLINWPKRLFDGTPLNRRSAEEFDAVNPSHRISFFYLYYHDRLLDDLSAFIHNLEQYGLYSDTYGKTQVPLSQFEADLKNLRNSMLESGDGSRAAELGDYREQYLKEVRTFVDGSSESLFLAELGEFLANPGLRNEEKVYYSELEELVPYLFRETRILLDDIASYRKFIREKVEDSIAVIGYTGTSTTDYGANPFERQYMNMGIYTAVYNSLLQGSFLRESPLWVSALFSLIAGIATVILTNISRKKTILNIFLGILAVILAILIAMGIFIFSGTYINMFPLIMTLITAYIASILFSFIATARQRALIQEAFGQIISPEIVMKIQENPNVLSISGENRMITAMFSDIESFSTIAEYLGSEKLFEFLKIYLTPMSNIIIEEQGTIDKFEGDAIIAFWSAPIDQDDHAQRACRAAIKMQHCEQVINQQLIQDGILTEELLSMLPHRKLFTRIGINTGINNVGFIGTDKRKEYTALGDQMNIASRLEGVNKHFGTQILLSDATQNFIEDDFITRKLIRIHVLGKIQPVMIYELKYSNDSLEDLTEVEIKVLQDFEKALTLFHSKNWDESELILKRIIKKIPHDGPTRFLLKRIRQYRSNPPPENWDAVYKMDTK